MGCLAEADRAFWGMDDVDCKARWNCFFFPCALSLEIACGLDVPMTHQDVVLHYKSVPVPQGFVSVVGWLAVA